MSDSKPTLLPREPEDWPRLFSQYINAGDLNAVAALYDPDARFHSPSGELMIGRDAMRAVLENLIRKQTRLKDHVIRCTRAGDIAMLYTNFDGATQDESGATVAMHSAAIEILRRHSDGTWRLIIGDPDGRGPAVAQ